MLMKMKKGFIVLLSAITAVLLVLAVAFMLTPKAAAHAEETHDHSAMTAISSYADITDGELNGETQAVAYYLTENINITTDSIAVRGNVTLCLNGHDITGDGENRVITVYSGAKFTLCDCQEEQGSITGGNAYSGGGVIVYADAEFTMTGGIIGNNYATSGGGGVYVSGAFTMTGGEIYGCEAYDGGGVYVNGSFKMTGGTIRENSTDYGGGVYVNRNYCSFEMTGGEIIGNTATSDGGGVYVGYIAQRPPKPEKPEVPPEEGEEVDDEENADGVSVLSDDGENNSNFTISGGTISGNDANEGGGVRVVDDGTFIMSGGEIDANSAVWGGGVSVADGAQFEMTGGTISNNTSELGGGGVFIYDTVFEMSGGAISNNTSDDSSGGVYVKGDFIMTGGAISGNTACYVGGVYVDGTYNGGGDDGDEEAESLSLTNRSGAARAVSGTFQVSGAPVITGNTAEDGRNNVYLPKNKTITVIGALEDGAQIGVALESAYSGVFTTGYGENNRDANNNIVAPNKYFISDNKEYMPALLGVEVEFADAQAASVKVGDGEEVTYKTIENAWTAANDAEAAAVVKLLANAETTDTLVVAQGKDITLDLNGYSVKSDGSNAVIGISDGASFTLCDGQGTGCIMGGDSLYGGGVCVADGGKFTMNSGRICGNTAALGGGVYVAENAEFTMNGGTISANIGLAGGGVCVEGAFTMTGGTISGNVDGIGDDLMTEGMGGGVAVMGGTFTMSGGTISKNMATGAGGVLIMDGTFTMSGGAISENASAGAGGVLLAMGTFKMSGGTISGNTQELDAGYGYCGGLCVGMPMDGYDGEVTFEISGSPVITGNTVTIDGATLDNNVLLCNGNKITVSGELEEGAEICVSIHGESVEGEVATGFTQEGKPSEYFIPDDTVYNCVFVSDETSGTVSIGEHTSGDWINDSASTCTEEGTKHKECSVCNTELETGTIDKIAHTLTHHAAVPATEEEKGNTEYWSCDECEKYFSDAAGTTEISDKSSVELPKLTAPAEPSAPAKDKQSYVWICLLLIPLALAACGVTLGIWTYKKGK